jgi:hypothetical protein
MDYMKKSLVTLLLLLGGSAEATKFWGFDLSTGPGYRQDRAEWSSPSNGEVYPHLRMFDWAIAFDASLGKVHLFGEGDRGWFSSQEMRKSADSAFPSPTSFTFSTSGKATTAFLYLGYQFGFKSTIAFTPMAGWMYDAEILHRSHPTPPFNRLTQNIPAPFTFADASIEMRSNLRQKWQGAMLGAQLTLQLLKSWYLQGSYAYGWLHFSQSFSETESLLYYRPGPVAASQVQTTVRGDTTGSGGHGNLGKFKTMILLSNSLSLDFDFRYFSLNSGKIKTSIEQTSGSSSQSSDQNVDASLSSAMFTAEMTYRF